MPDPKARQSSSGGEPGPAIPPAPATHLAALEPWLGRLHETVNNLAQRVAAQEARLDVLTRLLEASENPSSPPAHRLVVHAMPLESPRWRRLAGRLLRAPGVLWRRLEGIARSRWILPIADPGESARRLSLGEDVLAIEISGKASELPAGYLELALLQMAVEDLHFLHLVGKITAEGPLLQLWLCRRKWPWRGPADLAERLAKIPGKGPLLGKEIYLDGESRQQRSPAALAACDRLADYWLRPGAATSIRLKARTGSPAAQPARKAGRVAILTTRPLDSGLEVLVAAIIRRLVAAGKEVLLASTYDLRSSHRSLAEVAPRDALLYPLATFSAPELRASLLALLLAEGLEAIWQIGPGEGIFDQPALQQILQQVPIFDLPLPLLPGNHIELGRPPDVVRRKIVLEAEPDGLLLPPAIAAPAGGKERGKERSQASREAARERLGVPPGAYLVCQMADLVPNERPEDLIELAARCPNFFFLQIGRGALAGRRDDLLRFRAVTNVRCLPAADLAEVLAASDALLALGEPSLWPWPIFAALATQVPVIGRAAGPLATLSAAIAVADTVPDMAGRLEALREGQLAPRLQGEPESQTFEAALSGLIES